MPRISKKLKQEWVLFLNERNRNIAFKEKTTSLYRQ